MPRRFLIQLQSDSAAAGQWRSRWRRLDVDDSTHVGFPDDVSDGDHCTVLVPGEDVLLLSAPALPGSRRQREKAVAYAVEEQLVAPVESQHVVLADDLGGATSRLAAIDQSLVGHIASFLAASAIEADRMLPDSWLLSVAEPASPARLLLDGQRVLLSVDAESSLVGSLDELRQWLPLLLAQGRLTQGIDVWHDGSGWPADIAEPPGMRLQPAVDPLAFLALRLQQADTINLLQGAHRPQRRVDALVRRWRMAALLIVAAGVISLIHALLDHRALSAQLAQQEIEMQQTFRQLVPDATRVFDPVNQLRSRLSLGTSDKADAMRLLRQTAPLFAGANVLPLVALDYRDQQMDITLQASSVSALDALRQQLAELPGLTVQLTSVTPGQGATEGRLRIESRGAADGGAGSP